MGEADGGRDAEATRSPDPAIAVCPAGFVKRLNDLRLWAGCPSLRRLRMLAGQTRSVDGHVVDALPISTTSALLAGKRLPRLPRGEFVEAYVRACLTAAALPDREMAGEVRRWMDARHRVELASVQQLPDDKTTSGTDGGTQGAGVVPRQLPAPPRCFTGRFQEQAELTDAMTSHREEAMAVSMIVGPAGAGKTWLALRWAHDNIDRYRDGQLHLNLRGFDPSGRPTPPHEAVRTFLVALGVAPVAIPAGLDAQVGLYRSLVAGRRLLILLDNARDADQVRPLLPGTAGCAVIITSRHQLTGLIATEAADLITLGVLMPEDAHRLLARRLGEQRLAIEPDATAEILDRCAGLPLALALVAARAASRPKRPLQALADDLRDSRDRLDALAGDAPDTGVRAVLSWSYDALAPDAARLFRLLGLHPGPDIDVLAAASLGGITTSQARRLLAELTRAHLATEVRADRYSLHDLLRLYAAEQAHSHDEEQQRRAATGRMLDHYLHAADTAALRLSPHREPVISAVAQGVTRQSLTEHRHALEWFAREHRVLAAVIHACGPGFESYAWRLADVLGVFFTRRGHWHDWHATTQAALRAAHRAHDPGAQARAHCWLAEIYARIGRLDDTSAHLDEAQRLYEKLADLARMAYVHLCRGWVHEPRHGYRQALHHAEQALRLYRMAGDERGQANALNNIGWYNARLGQHRLAIEYCQQALVRHQELGDRAWESRTWDALGYAHHRLRHFDQATSCYERALKLLRDLGNRYRESIVLNRLGEAHADAGEPDAAARSWQLASEIVHELQPRVA